MVPVGRRQQTTEIHTAYTQHGVYLNSTLYTKCPCQRYETAKTAPENPALSNPVTYH